MNNCHVSWKALWNHMRKQIQISNECPCAITMQLLALGYVSILLVYYLCIYCFSGWLGKIKSIIHSADAYIKTLGTDYTTTLILIWAVNLLSMEKVINANFDITLSGTVYLTLSFRQFIKFWEVFIRKHFSDFLSIFKRNHSCLFKHWKTTDKFNW